MRAVHNKARHHPAPSYAVDDAHNLPSPPARRAVDGPALAAIPQLVSACASSAMSGATYAALQVYSGRCFESGAEVRPIRQLSVGQRLDGHRRWPGALLHPTPASIQPCTR